LHAALRLGGPGRLPAQGSHRSGRARTSASGSSVDSGHPPIGKGPRRRSTELRGHGDEPQSVRHVSLDRVCRPTPRFPPQGPPGRVPLLLRYYQGAATSCRPSRRASFSFAWRYHGCTVCFAPPVYPVRPGGLELFARYLRPGSCRGDDRISQVPGVPRLSVCPCSSTPAGLLVPDQLRNSSVAPAIQTTKAPTMYSSFEAQ